MFEKDVTGTGTERMLLKENVNGPDQISSDGSGPRSPSRLAGHRMSTCCRRQEIGNRNPTCRRRFPKVEPQFSPDVLGSRTLEREWKKRNLRPPVPWTAVASSRAAAAVSRCGVPMARNCSTSATTGGSWRLRCRRRPYPAEYGVPQFLFEMRANVFNSRNSYIPSRTASGSS